MKLSKLVLLSLSGLFLFSCGDKKGKNEEKVDFAKFSKIDSVSYAMGYSLATQIKMVKGQLAMTGTKFNEKAYLEGFDDDASKLSEDQIKKILSNFSELQRKFMTEGKKGTDIKISEDGLKTMMDSVSYALGSKFGKSSKRKVEEFENQLKFKANKDLLTAGYKSGSAANDSVYRADAEKFGKTLVEFQKEKIAEVYKGNKEAGEKFLAENKTKEGVKTTDSGLQYQVLKEGKGEKPQANSVVKVHYHGTLIDGSVFDSSVERKQPATFPLNRVIKGWTEGLQLMPVGSKYKFFVPYNLGYGDQLGPKIKPFSTLVFEVELLEVVKPKEKK